MSITTTTFLIASVISLIDILLIIRFIYVDKKLKQQNEKSHFICEKDKVDEMLVDIFFPYKKQKVDKR